MKIKLRKHRCDIGYFFTKYSKGYALALNKFSIVFKIRN